MTSFFSRDSFAVRKANYNFSLALAGKMKSHKDVVLKQNCSCVYQSPPYFKVTLFEKMSIVHRWSLKKFQVVWFLTTVSNSTWLCTRRWVYKKKLWNIENSFGMLETLFTLKVTVFFHVSLDQRSWIKKWQHINTIFRGFSRAPRVRILRVRLGENCGRD